MGVNNANPTHPILQRCLLMQSQIFGVRVSKLFSLFFPSPPPSRPPPPLSLSYTYPPPSVSLSHSPHPLSVCMYVCDGCLLITQAHAMHPDLLSLALSFHASTAQWLVNLTTPSSTESLSSLPVCTLYVHWCPIINTQFSVVHTYYPISTHADGFTIKGFS